MRTGSCESDLSFDLLLAGDLPADDERRVRLHVETCRVCADRWAELRDQRDAFVLLMPAVDVSRRFAARPWRPRRWLVPAATLASAAALLVALWPRDQQDLLATTRGKGAGMFRAYIRHGDTVRKAGDAEIVYPGDQLQFSYTSPRPGFVAILSRDGAGLASIYFPDPGPTREVEAAVAPAGRDRVLPRSTILDDTPGYEVVYAFFCSAPIDLEPLRVHLAVEGAVAAPPGCTVETLEFHKRSSEEGVLSAEDVVVIPLE